MDTDYVAGDDDIVITVHFQMTDAFANDPETLQRMEFGASAGTYMIWVGFEDFALERDGTEVPDLIVDYTLTPSSAELVPG